MRSLELKIPPPVVALLVGLLMWFASWLATPLDVPFAWRFGAGLAIAGLAVIVDGAGLLAFVRAKTTVNPMRPSSASSLVTSGVYRLTRNPMYLGLLLFLFAWAVFLAAWPSLLLVAVFVWYITRFQIQPEERALAERFGAEYSAYTAKVRRWI